jgi:hypothetical protein
VTLTGKSAAGAGVASTVNCTAAPSVTGLAPGAMVTAGTGRPEPGGAEHPASARSMTEPRIAAHPGSGSGCRRRR